jgi:hypothetical protein
MNNVVTDFYRCPETLIGFEADAHTSSPNGFFNFGTGTICYGRASCGVPAHAVTDRLVDLRSQATFEGCTLRLPFDVSQVVENLRCERYANNGYTGKSNILGSEVMRKVYYAVRPLMPIAVRKHFQRAYHRKWDRLPFPKWPVDNTVEQILKNVLRLHLNSGRGATGRRIPFIWFWPDGASGCVMVTHDVETKAGFEYIPRLMDINDTFGIKASFQIVPEKQYPVPPKDLATIRNRGFEVAIQDLTHTGNLFDDRERFFERAQSINRYVREWKASGFRSGRMYRNPEWYSALNISYDMSIPNVASLDPQRGGCCTVFPYFIGDIVELPLTTIQDYSLFHILGSRSMDLWEQQIQQILRENGLISILVHPDYITQPNESALYQKLLKRLSEARRNENVWIPLPRDVDSWWRERSRMRIVAKDGRFCIEGPGRERARIAYASLVKDEVVYSLEDGKRLPSRGPSVLGLVAAMSFPLIQSLTEFLPAFASAT